MHQPLKINTKRIFGSFGGLHLLMVENILILDRFLFREMMANRNFTNRVACAVFVTVVPNRSQKKRLATIALEDGYLIRNNIENTIQRLLPWHLTLLPTQYPHSCPKPFKFNNSAPKCLKFLLWTNKSSKLKTVNLTIPSACPLKQYSPYPKILFANLFVMRLPFSTSNVGFP